MAKARPTRAKITANFVMWMCDKELTRLNEVEVEAELVYGVLDVSVFA